jgi:hypothetical protein
VTNYARMAYEAHWSHQGWKEGRTFPVNWDRLSEDMKADWEAIVTPLVLELKTWKRLGTTAEAACLHWSREAESLTAERDALRAENARLKQALESQSEALKIESDAIRTENDQWLKYAASELVKADIAPEEDPIGPLFMIGLNSWKKMRAELRELTAEVARLRAAADAA